MFEGREVVDNIKSLHAASEKQRRAGLIRRLGEFLSADTAGNPNHPAAAAREALEAGKMAEVITYLRAEIDKAEEEGNEARRGELMRWKTNLNSNGN